MQADTDPRSRDQLPRFPDLDGKVALVTGGSAGIGAATCRALAGNGVKVVVADLDEAGIERTVERIESQGGQARGAVADITDPSTLAAARQIAEDAFGTVEILAPFAGGFRDYTGIEDLTDGEWNSVIELNLTGTYWTIKAFLAGMVGLGRGSIITMGSSSARYLDALVTAPYAAAKAGVVMMTKHLALELGPKGIRVNSVCPSTTRTERVEKMVSAERQAKLAALSPLGRMGEPIDVANATLYLASDASSWVTGACIDIAGGRIVP